MEMDSKKLEVLLMLYNVNLPTILPVTLSYFTNNYPRLFDAIVELSRTDLVKTYRQPKDRDKFFEITEKGERYVKSLLDLIPKELREYAINVPK